MNKSVIHISSVKREKIGTNKPHDFIVKFNPPLKLDPGFKHYLALDRLSMTYSWYNIRSSYANNTIKYTHDGTTWQTWIKKVITQQTPKEQRCIQSI